VRAGLRLAYSTPLLTASYRLSWLSAQSKDDGSRISYDGAEEIAIPENQNPVAVPGKGFETTDDGDGFATVTLDGSSSADGDGTIVSFKWTLKGEWLSDQAVAIVRLPIGTHRVLLTVEDDKGAIGQAKIRIRVKAGESTVVEEASEDAEPAEVSLPRPPYGVESKQKNTEVAITWKVDPDVPAPYRIYRAIDDEIDDPELTVEEEYDALHWILIREEWEKLSYRDADVQVGVPYLYAVRSFDGVNESERSNVAAITVQQIDEEPVGEAPPEEPGADPTEPPVQEAPPTNTPVPDTPTPVPDTPTPVPDTPTPVVEPEVEEPPPDEEAEAEG